MNEEVQQKLDDLAGRIVKFVYLILDCSYLPKFGEKVNYDSFRRSIIYVGSSNTTSRFNKHASSFATGKASPKLLDGVWRAWRRNSGIMFIYGENKKLANSIIEEAVLARHLSSDINNCNTSMPEESVNKVPEDLLARLGNALLQDLFEANVNVIPYKVRVNFRIADGQIPNHLLTSTFSVDEHNEIMAPPAPIAHSVIPNQAPIPNCAIASPESKPAPVQKCARKSEEKGLPVEKSVENRLPPGFRTITKQEKSLIDPPTETEDVEAFPSPSPRRFAPYTRYEPGPAPSPKRLSPSSSLEGCRLNSPRFQIIPPSPLSKTEKRVSSSANDSTPRSLFPRDDKKEKTKIDFFRKNR